MDRPASNADDAGVTEEAENGQESIPARAGGRGISSALEAASPEDPFHAVQSRDPVGWSG